MPAVMRRQTTEEEGGRGDCITPSPNSFLFPVISLFFFSLLYLAVTCYHEETNNLEPLSPYFSFLALPNTSLILFPLSRDSLIVTLDFQMTCSIPRYFKMKDNLKIAGLNPLDIQVQ